MPRLTETRAVRLNLPPKGQTFEWCSEIKGFGVRLTPTGRRYIVQGRDVEGRGFRLTLGPVGVLPFEGPAHAPGARDLALAALNAARRGEDPRIALGKAKAPEGPTLSEVWADYEAAGYPKIRGVGRKRPTTIKADKDRYAKHFRPVLGKELVSSIDTTRVRRWLDRIKSDGQRNHCLVFLKSLRSFALSRDKSVAWPEIGIKAGKSKEVQNFYTVSELARIDAAVVELMAEQPARRMGFAALRLLLMTGARKSEILSLRWKDVDLADGVLELEKDKNSDNRRDILLDADAVALLNAIPRSSSPFVFFADSAAGHTLYIEKHRNDAIARAGVARHRIHDLRHSFVSSAIKNGVSLYVAGKLVGHRQATTTQRYAHLEHDVGRAALDRVSKARTKAVVTDGSGES